MLSISRFEQPFFYPAHESTPVILADNQETLVRLAGGNADGCQLIPAIRECIQDQVIEVFVKEWF